MGINLDRAYNKIMASYATGVRGDLDIADFQKLDAVTAHVLLEFEPSIGKPSANDIERYFGKMFEGRILPMMAEASVKPGCVSILAQLNVPTRDITDADDKAKMTPVMAGMMYMDNNLKDVWHVSQDTEGKKILAKEGKENIDQIIAARRNRLFITKSSNVSLSSLATARDLIPMGSTVRAYHQGKVQEFTLEAKVQGGFKAKKADGKAAVISAEGVIDLIKMADDAPNENAKIVKYFSEAYGDKKYASLLIKK